MLILYYTINVLTRPLKGLTKVVQKFSVQDFSARNKITTRDEIGKLSEVFNRMADSIEEYSTTMEIKVADRTADLNRTLKDV